MRLSALDISFHCHFSRLAFGYNIFITIDEIFSLAIDISAAITDLRPFSYLFRFAIYASILSFRYIFISLAEYWPFSPIIEITLHYRLFDVLSFTS